MRFATVLAIHAAAALGSAALTSEVLANCANYTDGSMSTPAPRGIICYRDKCDLTTLDYVCTAGPERMLVGYAIGWTAEITTAGSEVYWKGKLINSDKARHITCKEIDADFCFIGQ